MIRKTNIFLLAAICLVGIMIAPVKGAQTTGLTGAAFPSQARIDLSQYTSDGLAGDAVFFYNSTTGLFELDDSFGGGILGGGTVNGQMLFWDQTGADWELTTAGAGVNEMYWDDTNKSLGIGNDADDNTDISFLSIADTTFTDTDDFYGISVSYTKTAGDTTGADAYYGIAAAINHNFADTIGDLTALSGASTMTLGTSADVIGLLCGTAMNGGTATSSYGIYNTSDVAAGMTALTNIYGAYHIVDNDEPLGGSMWGQLTDVNQVLGAVTGNVIGHSIDFDMTATSANNTIGLLNVSTFDGAITIGDDILGISNAINITNVTTITDDVYGISDILTIADDVADDVIAINVILNQTAGTIGGDYHGIFVDTDSDSTVTGDAYGITIDGDDGVTADLQILTDADTNFSIYQTGTSGDAYQEGGLIRVPVTLTMGNTGTNADLTLPDGYNFLTTGPTGATELEGLTNGTDGRMIMIYNQSGQNLTIENEEGTSTAANRITTPTGGDLAMIGAGALTLMYDGGTSRWLVINWEA
jgi:hypothetical protein